MTDYYSILGINKGATDDDIKRAYRKLALKYHPDKADATNAEESKKRFQEIQEAYETLSDPNKRSQYDNPSPPANFPFDFHFNNFFGQQQSSTVQKRPDHFYTHKISLKDAYNGCVKKFKIKRESLCALCNVKCSTCNGNGCITQRVQLGPLLQCIQHGCNVCSGSGIKQTTQSCGKCGPNKKTTEERLVEIQIPSGVEDGKQYVYEEWGEQAQKLTETPGNLVVIVQIEKDPYFHRMGADLVYSVSLTLAETIIGKEIVIPHFDGNIVLNTRGFGVINPNKQYTLYNRGMNKNGNLHLRFNIEYPNVALQEDQAEELSRVFSTIGL